MFGSVLRLVDVFVWAAEPGQFVLELKFSTLEFGDLGILGGRVMDGLLEFSLERVVLALEFGQVVLKRHSAFSSVTGR